MLDPAAYHDALERDAASFIEVVRTSDAAARVPACPGWDLTALARHLGAVHRWATAVLLTGREGDLEAGPDDPDDLVPWLREGAAALVGTLRSVDPDGPTWTFGPPPHRTAFWGRRQAQETAIHLVDAQQAAGLPVTLPTQLAADGVDEVVTMFFPRQVRLGRIPPLDQGMRLDLVDVPGVSGVLAGDGTDPNAAAAATLRGPAADVLLVLWGRSAPDTLTIDGDPDVVRSVLAAGITP